MERYVDEDAIRQLAHKIAKNVKTEADLGDFSKLLKKIVVETALDAELTDHLGYDKNSPKGNGSGNSRNGKSKKRLKGDHDDVDLDIPRDRVGTYEPQLINVANGHLKSNRCSHGSGNRMANTNSGATISRCLSGLHCGENQREPASD